MAQVEVTIKRLTCMRCGHEWVPNSENRPQVCPLCHSPYWSRPRMRRGNAVSARRRAAAWKQRKKVPESMFGVSPDLPTFKREEDDFRV